MKKPRVKKIALSLAEFNERHSRIRKSVAHRFNPEQEIAELFETGGPTLAEVHEALASPFERWNLLETRVPQDEKFEAMAADFYLTYQRFSLMFNFVAAEIQKRPSQETAAALRALAKAVSLASQLEHQIPRYTESYAGKIGDKAKMSNAHETTGEFSERIDRFIVEEAKKLAQTPGRIKASTTYRAVFTRLEEAIKPKEPQYSDGAHRKRVRRLNERALKNRDG